MYSRGKPETITAIQELFQSMKEKEKTEEGQLPEFISKNNGGYFFNIYWNMKAMKGNFSMKQKWSPNIEVIQKIAEHYEVNFYTGL